MQPSAAVSGPVPIPANLLTIPGVLGGWALEVASVTDRGPRIRCISLAGPELAGFTYEPGQDVMLILDRIGERALSRRYSIRRFDPSARQLDLEIVLHDADGPGQRWVSSIRAGERVSVVGPRGKISLNPDAAWHLFLGDETFAPASLCMLESLPADTPAVSILEIEDADDEQAVQSKGANKQVAWLKRGGHGPSDGAAIMHALDGLALPSGPGHAYIAGEVQFVAALQQALGVRGFAPDQLSPKAYWGRAKSNGPHGEPDKPR